MSKRRRRSKKIQGGRDLLTPIANRSRLPRRNPLIRDLSQVLLDIARLSGQDRRRFNPTKKFMPAQSVSGMTAPRKIQKYKPLAYAKEQFSDPRKVTICIRRKQRKEVLHALGKNGKNGTKNRYRRTQASSFAC
nr:MAG: hypothetical protein [Microvirus sp.]